MADKSIPQLPETLAPDPNDLLILQNNKTGETTNTKAYNFLGRTKLTEDTTFYVDKASGDDSNSGLTLTDKWKTIKHAFEYIASLDLNNYHITLEIEKGDYVEEGLLHLPLLVGAASETCFFVPEGPSPEAPAEAIETHLDIGPIGFKDGQFSKEALILPPLEADNFGYYSINNATIRLDGPGIFTF